MAASSDLRTSSSSSASSSSESDDEAMARFRAVALDAADIERSASRSREANERRKAAAARRAAGGGGLRSLAPGDGDSGGEGEGTGMLDATQLRIADALHRHLDGLFDAGDSAESDGGDERGGSGGDSRGEGDDGEREGRSGGDGEGIAGAGAPGSPERPAGELPFALFARAPTSAAPAEAPPPPLTAEERATRLRRRGLGPAPDDGELERRAALVAVEGATIEDGVAHAATVALAFVSPVSSTSRLAEPCVGRGRAHARAMAREGRYCAHVFEWLGAEVVERLRRRERGGRGGVAASATPAPQQPLSATAKGAKRRLKRQREREEARKTAEGQAASPGAALAVA